ncbi:metallophosphoesterase family protein [Hamadaea tsunoensis]|uniref:metallophosphoesterase family protein n=1 Tax=Hamadaea tsunoensis TaxID=53368 RepID=UPI00041A59FE|nr:metallophosphoesterase [Hamadaea tsunoensis]
MVGLAPGTVWAVSDLHVAYDANKAIVEAMRPAADDDWLLVAGDVGENFADIEWTLKTLAERYATVVWSPGNHELWTPKDDPVQSRGVARYEALVEMCRGYGVHTPEDPFPVWNGDGGPITVAPLFLLYDYSFRPEGATTTEEGLALAYAAGIVCTDEFFLHPDPYATRAEWCAARVAYSEKRLSAVTTPTILMNHWPLVREPTRILRHQVFAQWCGTELTADWHTRFGAHTVVYGHLHIPRTTAYDGVPFEEVSLGYPREWTAHGGFRGPRRILPRAGGRP